MSTLLHYIPLYTRLDCISAFQELWTPSVHHILFEYTQYAPLIYGEVFHTLCLLHGWKSNTNYNIVTDVQNIEQSINPTPFALWCVLSAEHVLNQQITAFTNLLNFIVTYLSWLQDLAVCFMSVTFCKNSFAWIVLYTHLNTK